MKYKLLKPWIQGNRNLTPKNFYANVRPCIEMGAFVTLDIAVDLHLAHTVDTGNLYDSWHKNKKYIKNACEIVNVDENNSFDLEREDEIWITQALGEPPESCYNLYFVTVYNETEEKLVYIGKTDSKKSRFVNGHLVALKLHNPMYNEYCKRVYFGTIMFLSKDKQYIPLEFITLFGGAEKYLNEIEAFLISWFNPELNVKNEKIGKMKDLAIIHIQNFSEVSHFLHDYMVYGN